MNREDANLELLALGLLSDVEAAKLYEAMSEDPELREEYESIQKILERVALENAVPAPQTSLRTAMDQISAGRNSEQTRYVSIYKRPLFRMAASVLLLTSLLTNIYLLGRKNKTQTSEDSNTSLVGELPLSAQEFDQMFDHLHNSLSATPCQMDYRLTKQFLAGKGIKNTQEIIRFLVNNGGHCDCEVLMNVSLRFPRENYHHGSPIPETRPNPEIRISQNHTYVYEGSLMASNE